jgi:phospholipid/cholesterol/gamma-HCH transport system ATP-binding protein
MKHMIGLIEPDEGRVIIDGDDIWRVDEKQFKRYLRKIGVLFQAGGLLGSMTVAENIALPLTEFTNLPPSLIDSVVEMKLNLVNLEGVGDHLPAELSGGMKKRAGLARAMALNPKILFFDEPSAGLDPITSADIDNLILHLNRSLGTTMVIVTHELQSIFTVAHRVVMLDPKTKGIIAEGDPGDLRDHSRNETVRNFFNRLPATAGLPEEMA